MVDLPELPPNTVPELLATLEECGVYLWHNRGRLYFSPKSAVSGEVATLLGRLKVPIVEHLKLHPMCAFDQLALRAPVAPQEGGYAGRLARKPWDYEVALVLPTFGQPDLVQAALRCWRNQTVTPYLIVVSTGGEIDLAIELEDLQDYDCEVHYIYSHGWRHSSSPVSAALDLAFAICQQDRAVLTHVDVFPRHDRVIEQLLDRVGPSSPVVGYQMSPRVGSDEWRQCVSHTLTAVDLRVMRRARATWNLLASLEADDEVEQRYLGWPDTETQFGRSLRAAGIVPEFLGPEPNVSLYETDLVVHWRSLPSIRHYAPDQVAVRYPGLEAWLQETLRLGRAAPLPPREPPQHDYGHVVP